MAEGSRYASYFVKELSSGVTPGDADFKVFRATKSGLDINITALQSEEIRNDAEIADFRLGTRHVEGTATGELSYGTFDDLIAAAVRGSWQNDELIAGILRQSFTFIDYNADIQDLPYTVYRGCEVNTMNIKVSAAAMTTIEFGMVGRTMEQLAELPLEWSIEPRTSTSPMDGFSGSLTANGQEISVITELAIDINNGIEPRFVIGSKYSIKPGAKRRNVTGTMTAYYEDNSLRLAYLNELEQAIVMVLSDGASGNTYEFTVPRVKITEAPHPVDGEGDIMLNMSYRGLLDPTEATSIKVVRKVVVPDAEGVIITPAFVPTVAQGATKQFTAQVVGTTDQGVAWTVSPASNGTITTNGLFTAAANATGKTQIIATSTKTSSVKGIAIIDSFDTSAIPALTSYQFSMDSGTVTPGTLSGTAPNQTLTIAAVANGVQILQLAPLPSGASVGTPAVKTGATGTVADAAISAGKLRVTPKAAGNTDIVVTDGANHDTTIHIVVSA